MMPSGNDGSTTMRRATDLALVVLFLVGITVPLIGLVGGIDPNRIAGENRRLAAPPRLGPGGVRELRRQTDEWFDDHFGFRSTLVATYGRIQFGLFGGGSTRDVVVGRDGWLFYAREHTIEGHCGLLPPFTAAELTGWQQKIEQRRDWLAARAIPYVLVIAPDKVTIYPEMLPPAWQSTFGPTRTDQVLAWMAAHSTVEIIDLRPVLREAKARDRVYHRTDSHWNDIGAFAGYRRIAAWLHPKFPPLRPLTPTDVRREETVGVAGDLAGLLAIVAYLREERIALVATTPSSCVPVALTPLMAAHERWYVEAYECPEAGVGRAVVIRDSFFDALQPYFTGHFRRVVYVRHMFASALIAAENPDVVVEEAIERVFTRTTDLLESDLPGG